jgi:hypothetical protein
VISLGCGEMGTLGERAVAALERMREGTCTAGEVAAIAAEVIKNPPAVVRAAHRYLQAIGTEHEGMAAVELLSRATGADETGSAMNERIETKPVGTLP